MGRRAVAEGRLAFFCSNKGHLKTFASEGFFRKRCGFIGMDWKGMLVCHSWFNSQEQIHLIKDLNLPQIFIFKFNNFQLKVYEPCTVCITRWKDNLLRGIQSLTRTLSVPVSVKREMVVGNVQISWESIRGSYESSL